MVSAFGGSSPPLPAIFLALPAVFFAQPGAAGCSIGFLRQLGFDIYSIQSLSALPSRIFCFRSVPISIGSIYNLLKTLSGDGLLRLLVTPKALLIVTLSLFPRTILPTPFERSLS